MGLIFSFLISQFGVIPASFLHQITITQSYIGHWRLRQCGMIFFGIILNPILGILYDEPILFCKYISILRAKSTSNVDYFLWLFNFRWWIVLIHHATSHWDQKKNSLQKGRQLWVKYESNMSKRYFYLSLHIRRVSGPNFSKLAEKFTQCVLW